MLDNFMAAVLKSIMNVSPRGYSSSSDVLDYCVSRNLKFIIAVPESSLPAFHSDPLSPSSSLMETCSLPHEAGWMESDINDYRGVADLNRQYLHNVHKVLRRENAGAFIMEGGVLLFIAKYLSGSRVMEQLMTGPSVIVHHFHKATIHFPEGSYYDSHYLLQEPLSNGEERAIYGYVEQYDADSRTLLPTTLMMIRYFTPFL